MSSMTDGDVSIPSYKAIKSSLNRHFSLWRSKRDKSQTLLYIFCIGITETSYYCHFILSLEFIENKDVLYNYYTVDVLRFFALSRQSRYLNKALLILFFFLLRL